eukprot:SAG31_NODE_27168_length_430_cov_0.933535_1_plen_77_part_10
MWQLSFALPDEATAVALATQPPGEVLATIRARLVQSGWHDTVIELLDATDLLGCSDSFWAAPLYDALPPRPPPKGAR